MLEFSGGACVFHAAATAAGHCLLCWLCRGRSATIMADFFLGAYKPRFSCRCCAGAALDSEEQQVAVLSSRLQLCTTCVLWLADMAVVDEEGPGRSGNGSYTTAARARPPAEASGRCPSPRHLRWPLTPTCRLMCAGTMSCPAAVANLARGAQLGHATRRSRRRRCPMLRRLRWRRTPAWTWGA